MTLDACSRMQAASLALPSDPLIQVQKITKSFGASEPNRPKNGVLAIDQVSFEVGRGELVAFLGPSGCGKTTLLRLIAGLIKPDQGSVRINGALVREPRPDVCVVFQNFGLLPWRSVLRNIGFPLEIDGIPYQRSLPRIRNAMQAVGGLEGFENRFPHELSGGMQQRVGIARALVRQPTLILLDEPFAALDAQTREVLQEDVVHLFQRVGTTGILVTHSIDEALVMCDRIIIFSPRPGEIRADVTSPIKRLPIEEALAHPEFARLRREIRQILRTAKSPFGNSDLEVFAPALRGGERPKSPP